MKYLFAPLFCALLSGCGGGGGGGSPSVPNPLPAVPRNSPPLFMYFGVVGRQLEETADHCSCVYPMDWGNWDTDHDAIADRIVAQLQEAKARGYTAAVIAVGFTMFTKAYVYKGAAGLTAFRDRVLACGGPRVVGISIIDEPDMAGIADAVMRQAFNDARAAWPDVKIFAVYGDHGTPGVSAADVIGRDHYPDLVTLPLQPHQSQWLFAGGADPWKADPESFRFYAEIHQEVAAVCAFMWGDRPAGQDSGPGIRSNGMAAKYKAVALALGSKSPTL